MIVRLKAEFSDEKVIIQEFLREKIYQNPESKVTDYTTPDLSEPSKGIIDAVDKFNYGLMSKTEFTEYLYRVFGESTGFWVRSVNAFVDDGPIGFIEYLF